MSLRCYQKCYFPLRALFTVFFPQSTKDRKKVYSLQDESILMEEVAFPIAQKVQQSRTLDDLRPNATYEVQVYAVNEYGDGDAVNFTFYTALGESKLFWWFWDRKSNFDSTGIFQCLVYPAFIKCYSPVIAETYFFVCISFWTFMLSYQSCITYTTEEGRRGSVHIYIWGMNVLCISPNKVSGFWSPRASPQTRVSTFLLKILGVRATGRTPLWNCSFLGVRATRPWIEIVRFYHYYVFLLLGETYLTKT